MSVTPKLSYLILSLKFRMFRHVYGLSYGRRVRKLAVDSRTTFSAHMRDALALAVEGELLDQHRLVVAA